MAKVFAPPKEVGDFNYDFENYDYKKYEAAEAAYLEKLRAALPKYSKTPTDPLIGEQIRTPVADGYACYFVLSTKPLELVHVPTDEYHADPVWIRGLRLSDIKQMAEQAKRIRAIFSKEK